MLEIYNISKVYNMGAESVHALREITLKIEEGDFVAIMGPSGSGKSTLMHILGLLDFPDKGEYKLNNKLISYSSDDDLAILRRENVGFIFQQFNLLYDLTANENVALPLLYSKKMHAEEIVPLLLSKVRLQDRSQHRPNQLSGGQQQRVAIARSLVNSPHILFADEPTGNLDSMSEKEVLQILKDLNAQGITIVMVTHEEDIAHEAKRIIRMRDGVILSDQRLIPLIDKVIDKPTKVLAKPFSYVDFFTYIHQGVRTLMRHKVRTALSVLGILIGVAAVIAMMAIGQGAQKSIEAEFASLGSNLLVLRTGSMRMGGVAHEAGSQNKLSLEDATLIKNKIKHVKNVSTAVSSRGQVVFQNKNWNTLIQGVSPSYVDMHSSRPVLGRIFSEEENMKRSRIAVIGTTVARELFGKVNPVGETIKINKVPFFVIGLLPEKGAAGFRDQDDIILIPVLSAMYRVFGKENVDSIEIEMDNIESTKTTPDDILQLVYARHNVPLSQRDTAYSVMNLADIQTAVSQTSKTLSLLLASIAAISLLVGGIGIMNIMLVSVTERTREIGLRKAIGARRRDILLQFLIESILVSVFGGVLGIILGAVISFSISTFAGWSAPVSYESVILSFLFSASIGIIFGIYPARRAAHLHPIEALRYE